MEIACPPHRPLRRKAIRAKHRQANALYNSYDEPILDLASRRCSGHDRFRGEVRGAIALVPQVTGPNAIAPKT